MSTTTRRRFLQAATLGVSAAALPALTGSAQGGSIIDCHAHWVGPHVVELLGRRSSPHPPQGAG